MKKSNITLIFGSRNYKSKNKIIRINKDKDCNSNILILNCNKTNG